MATKPAKIAGKAPTKKVVKRCSVFKEDDWYRAIDTARQKLVTTAPTEDLCRAQASRKGYEVVT